MAADAKVNAGRSGSGGRKGVELTASSKSSEPAIKKARGEGGSRRKRTEALERTNRQARRALGK